VVYGSRVMASSLVHYINLPLMLWWSEEGHSRTAPYAFVLIAALDAPIIHEGL
jgi:hypothetical protein